MNLQSIRKETDNGRILSPLLGVNGVLESGEPEPRRGDRSGVFGRRPSSAESTSRGMTSYRPRS